MTMSNSLARIRFQMAEGHLRRALHEIELGKIASEDMDIFRLAESAEAEVRDLIQSTIPWLKRTIARPDDLAEKRVPTVASHTA